jgi:hypothetical protein
VKRIVSGTVRLLIERGESRLYCEVQELANGQDLEGGLREISFDVPFQAGLALGERIRFVGLETDDEVGAVTVQGIRWQPHALRITAVQWR